MNKIAQGTSDFPSAGQAAPTIATLPRRDLLLILTCLIAMTALAWTYLFHLARAMQSAMAQSSMMAAMGMAMNARWTAADVFLTFAMWTVMMVGMMGPSAAPMILVFASAQSKRRARGASLSAGIFALGYIGVWAAFSAGAGLAQWGLHETALLPDSMALSSARIGAAILIAAGIYQLTPWKNRCLAHCRSPLNFLMTHWREGKLGAFGMGARHGAYCLGCCWALMLVLFAVGVMNLAWVAALAAFVLLEKIGPRGALVARVSGVALISYGIFLFV
jgi:predicted metal-binding membrane protein